MPYAREEQGQLPLEYTADSGEDSQRFEANQARAVTSPYGSAFGSFPPLPIPPADTSFQRSPLAPTTASTPASRFGIALGSPAQVQDDHRHPEDIATETATSSAPLVEDPSMRNDGTVQPSPSPPLSGRLQFKAQGRRTLEHIEKYIGKDDIDFDETAITESTKSYFDLELGEAGPSSVGSDDSTGHKRQWHRFRSGATYDGQWLGGVRHGMGKQCWPDETVYVGEWRKGRACGRGEIRHSDGDSYTGEWVNGRAHGIGVFRHQGSHAIYEGEFRCDMREGFGVELWVDGSWFAGTFKKGTKHGFGEHRWPMPSGTYYVGCWRANELAGPGRYFVKDGPSYQGQWTNSVIDGAGVYTWNDGKQFEGQYKLDRKHGFGILTTDGESKESFWDMGTEADKDPFRKDARSGNV